MLVLVLLNVNVNVNVNVIVIGFVATCYHRVLVLVLGQRVVASGGESVVD